MRPNRSASCGFEFDRARFAAMNILQRGLTAPDSGRDWSLDEEGRKVTGSFDVGRGPGGSGSDFVERNPEAPWQLWHIRSYRIALRFAGMRFSLLALLVSGVAIVPLDLLGDPGLETASGGLALVRPWPRVALDPREGFTPASSSAGIEWSGDLTTVRAGEYRFFAEAASLRIDGQEIGPDPVRLEAGAHKFDLRADRRPGSARVSIEWEGPGFMREPIPSGRFSHEPGSADALDGRAIFEDLGCPNCHRSDSPSIQERHGPVLTGLGGRVNPAWIRHWLDAPEEFRSWATMPRMLNDSERADVTAFLSGGGTSSVEEPSFRKSNEERGRTTFQSFGCAACHGSDLPLLGLGSKATVGHLQQYLLDPIRFSPDGRMPSFHLDEAEALDLAAYLALSRNRAFETPRREGDATSGREIVQSSGCLACHTLDGLRSEAEAPSLASLDEAQGCLADEVPAGAPMYRLNDDERHALRRFVAGYRATPDVVAAPTFDLPRRMAQLRCHACHDVNGKAPTGSLAEVAPTLTGVGEKLQVEWVERVLSSNTRTLDWQELRMPSYGASHAAWLADALAKASGIVPGDPVGPHWNGSREAGRDRLGVDGASGGLGCVGCHGWGEFPSLGENGPNLSAAGQRLRPAWFKRWMRDPPRILAGTSMPNYFGGAESAEFLTAVSDFWAAFRAAPDMPPPFGFTAADASLRGEATPVPTDQAVVIRWDMPEATPAAIAVGLPGGISYCFDAGESRLRYAWRGGFVDMSRTLLSKKNRETNLTETAEIVGEIFFREGPYPLRMSDRERIPQRRFRGYRLIDSIPEFHYEVDGGSVYERIVPIERGFARHFRLVGVEQPMWFVPAEVEGVEIRSTLKDFEIPRGESVSFEVTVVAAE